jgi:hypothetical protein
MRFKILERITTQGFKKDIKDIMLAYCKEDKEYYLLEDPIIAKGFIKVDNEHYECDIKYRVIEFDTKEEIYKYYISSFARNCLNPFKLLMLYRKGIKSDIEAINYLLSSITIPDDIVNVFNEELDKIEKNNPSKRIIIDIEILKGLDKIYKLYIENKSLFDKLKVQLLDLFNDCINQENDKIIFAHSWLVVSIVKGIIARELDKEKRLNVKDADNTYSINYANNADNTNLTYNITINVKRALTSREREELCNTISKLLDCITSVCIYEQSRE